MKKGKRIMGPLILITIGSIFLMDNLGLINNAWSKLWPLIFIVIGLVKVVGHGDK